ncbi:MAG: alpha/beta hydrolase [Burkholderiaceae bacterium]|nr:alpha/beta hydrolase [Burkholderiaceae bacterium]
MPLHPLAKAHLALREQHGSKPFEDLSVEDAREMIERVGYAIFGDGPAVAQLEDRRIPGPHGEIPVRIYRPDVAGALPLLVYYHGGGWVVGNLETVDFPCRALANAAGCMVVSVNYRHAPEHRFPIPVDDCDAALRWVAEHAVQIGADPSRIAVGGASAGANLAAVVAHLARDRGGPALSMQLLTVPVTDYGLDTPSYRDNAVGYGLQRESMRWFWDLYLNDPAEGSDTRVSPLRAADLSGLPPAFVMTAEYDPLRDEGEAYAARLAAAGVPTQLKRYDGMIHMFLGPDALPDMASRLRAAFAR